MTQNYEDSKQGDNSLVKLQYAKLCRVWLALDHLQRTGKLFLLSSKEPVLTNDICIQTSPSLLNHYSNTVRRVAWVNIGVCMDLQFLPCLRYCTPEKGFRRNKPLLFWGGVVSLTYFLGKHLYKCRYCKQEQGCITTFTIHRI